MNHLPELVLLLVLLSAAISGAAIIYFKIVKPDPKGKS